jgi:ribosomal protein S25
MGLLDKAKAIKAPGAEKKKGLLDKAQQEKTLPQKIYTAGKVIETDFDALYNMILARRRVTISDIAGMFRIDKKMAEDWMQILEDHDLAKIHYPAMGEPEIRKNDAKKES